MPLIAASTYRAPFFLPTAHLQTIVPQLLPAPRVPFVRRRLLTPDQDFVDLDSASAGAERAAILSHDFEGSSRSAYVRRMAAALIAAGWDVFCWNQRGCSGEPNRLPASYHSGQAEDLIRVFSHVLFKKRYKRISLIGFGLGGAITLNFLGSQGEDLVSLVSRAVVISVPCSLGSAAARLEAPSNKLYSRYYLRRLNKKMQTKALLFPDIYKKLQFSGIKNLRDYDDRITAPLHGFKNAEEYWRTCSPSAVLNKIKVPTLIINAANDPFLGKECYPTSEVEKSDWVFLEIPPQGGHLGFTGGWSERRTIEFLKEDAQAAKNAA